MQAIRKHRFWYVEANSSFSSKLEPFVMLRGNPNRLVKRRRTLK
jgi:hypothetical protein